MLRCEKRSKTGGLMGTLTTHVLDTMSGRPAAGLTIELISVLPDGFVPLNTVTTNIDGRVDGALLDGDALVVGVYELRFHAGDYLRALGADSPDPPFLDIVPIRFGVSDPAAHYHVPLLLSPFGYSTYRGS
jgi:5-hydroxyisourate hydrolase